MNDLINLFFSRAENGFKQAEEFFRNSLIDTNTGVDNVHAIFVNVQKLYNSNLRLSINNELLAGQLQWLGNPLCYNYLILDGTKLYKLLENYNHRVLLPDTIANEHFEKFKELVDYAGKGINDRKLSHLISGKLILLKQLALKKINAKFSKITQIWERGHGIVILHLFTETNHFEAMSREFAIIKALGLNNITNVNNGSPYGAMQKEWNHFEVINYGNMLLFNALKMAINENPRLIHHEDILVKTRKTRKRKPSMEDYELEGILNCFLDL